MNAVKRIAFVGLGNMGTPMAARLVDHGFDVSVFDLRHDVTRAFVSEYGGTFAASVADVACRAEAVITMLPGDAAVRGVMLGTNGIRDRLPEGGVAIDMGTSSPRSTIAIARDLDSKGITLLDAPVMGGVRYAREGSLEVMVGGDAAPIERCLPIFAAIGKNTWRCGAIGSGHALKAIANFINAATLTVLSEGMVAGRKFGLDGPFLAAALEAMCAGRQHPLGKKIIPQVMTREFASGMAMGLISKDIGIAVELARDIGARASVAEHTLALWSEAVERFGAAADQTNIARLWEDAAMVTIE